MTKASSAEFGTNFSVESNRPDLIDYYTQEQRLPDAGHHLFVNRNIDSLVVYQAYSSEIALNVLKKGNFIVDGFRLNRTTWLKPNFLGMMYLSDWGRKRNQEIVLGIGIDLDWFKKVLELAFPTQNLYSLQISNNSWREIFRESSVIFQWDPDRRPDGLKLRRRAMQIGLRHEAIEEYASGVPIKQIYDMTPIVRGQRSLINEPNKLMVPVVREFEVQDELLKRRFDLTSI